MDENLGENISRKTEHVSYSRSNNSPPNFFDKFSSFFTKKTIAGLAVLVLIIGVGAATIAVQRSTEFRQRAAGSIKDPSGYYFGKTLAADEVRLLDDDVITGMTYSVGWDELEPSDDNHRWSLIESKKSQVDGKTDWHGRPKKLALRLVAGQQAPWWLKTVKKETVTFGTTGSGEVYLRNSGANFFDPATYDCRTNTRSQFISTAINNGRIVMVNGVQTGVFIKRIEDEVGADGRFDTLYVGNWIDNNPDIDVRNIVWKDGWVDTDGSPTGPPVANPHNTITGCKSNIGVNMVNYRKIAGEERNLNLPPELYAIPAPTSEQMLDKWGEFLSALGGQYDTDPLIARITPGGPQGALAEPFLTNTIVTENDTAPWRLPDTCNYTDTNQNDACHYSVTNIVNAWKEVINNYEAAFNQTPYNLYYSPMPANDGAGRTFNASEQMHAYAKLGPDQRGKQAGFYMPSGNFLSNLNPNWPPTGSGPHETVWGWVKDYPGEIGGTRGGFQIGGVEVGQHCGGAGQPSVATCLR